MIGKFCLLFFHNKIIRIDNRDLIKNSYLCDISNSSFETLNDTN